MARITRIAVMLFALATVIYTVGAPYIDGG